ncbi:NPP1 family protein, partial [Streptomyces sp. NPDC002920]
WNGYPSGLRDKLSAYDFGSANFGLKDANFAAHLSSAKPSGIAFDPNA